MHAATPKRPHRTTVTIAGSESPALRARTKRRTERLHGQILPPPDRTTLLMTAVATETARPAIMRAAALLGRMTLVQMPRRARAAAMVGAVTRLRPPRATLQSPVARPPRHLTARAHALRTADVASTRLLLTRRPTRHHMRKTSIPAGSLSHHPAAVIGLALTMRALATPAIHPPLAAALLPARRVARQLHRRAAATTGTAGPLVLLPLLIKQCPPPPHCQQPALIPPTTLLLF